MGDRHGCPCDDAAHNPELLRRAFSVSAQTRVVLHSKVVLHHISRVQGHSIAEPNNQRTSAIGVLLVYTTQADTKMLYHPEGADTCSTMNTPVDTACELSGRHLSAVGLDH